MDVQMIRHWTRHQLRAESGWEPGKPYVEGELLDRWSEPVGTDGRADLRPEPQLTFCPHCGEITTYGDGTLCFNTLLTPATTMTAGDHMTGG